jgi:(S)-2-hydroxyglutarate dehydrogenase
MQYDVAIIGGGIVGLATAFALTNRYPKVRVILLEKEASLASHQTGHNSGVIHSGIYYRPGSLKARFACDGNRKLFEFCKEHHIRAETCGKLIVACDQAEVPLLETLYQKGGGQADPGTGR